MKKTLFLAGFLFPFGLGHLLAQPDSNDWAGSKAKKWFNKKDWQNVLAITPHSSIDKIQFAKQYHLNQAVWHKAFAF